MESIEKILKGLIEKNLEEYIPLILELETEKNKKKLGKGKNPYLSDAPLKLDDSWRCPQMDMLSLSILREINEETTIIDFGSGPECILLFNLHLKDKTDIISKINYFAFSDDIIYDTIIKNHFYDVIKHFHNNKKDIFDVIYKINREDKIQLNSYKALKKADILICKNVIHEVTLVLLPVFLYNIFQLTKNEGKIIFFDLMDIEERKKFPWFAEDFKVLFKNILKEDIKIIQHDLPEYVKDESKKIRKPLIWCEISSRNDYFLLLISQLRRKLLKFYEEKSERLIVRKNELIDNLVKRENNRFKKELNDIISYHSNCEEQIKEAKKEWNL